MSIGMIDIAAGLAFKHRLRQVFLVGNRDDDVLSGNPLHFFDGFTQVLIREVFEHLTAEDEIKTVIRNRDRGGRALDFVADYALQGLFGDINAGNIIFP